MRQCNEQVEGAQHRRLGHAGRCGNGRGEIETVDDELELPRTQVFPELDRTKGRDDQTPWSLGGEPVAQPGCMANELGSKCVDRRFAGRGPPPLGDGCIDTVWIGFTSIEIGIEVGNRIGQLQLFRWQAIEVFLEGCQRPQCVGGERMHVPLAETGLRPIGDGVDQPTYGACRCNELCHLVVPRHRVPSDHAMHCPFCAGQDTRVIDSRSADAGASIRRRRACTACDRRFTTYERASVEYLVRKRDGSLEPFDGQKVRHGVEQALADRTVPEGSVDRLVDEIAGVVSSGAGEITADELGHEVLSRLRRLDEVAYLRFASVYKEFQGARDFEREVAALEKGG